MLPIINDDMNYHTKNTNTHSESDKYKTAEDPAARLINSILIVRMLHRLLIRSPVMSIVVIVLRKIIPQNTHNNQY